MIFLRRPKDVLKTSVSAGLSRYIMAMQKVFTRPTVQRQMKESTGNGIDRHSIILYVRFGKWLIVPFYANSSKSTYVSTCFRLTLNELIKILVSHPNCFCNYDTQLCPRNWMSIGQLNDACIVWMLNFGCACWMWCQNQEQELINFLLYHCYCNNCLWNDRFSIAE